jgi:hypothetical protein
MTRISDDDPSHHDIAQPCLPDGRAPNDAIRARAARATTAAAKALDDATSTTAGPPARTARRPSVRSAGAPRRLPAASLLVAMKEQMPR